MEHAKHKSSSQPYCTDRVMLFLSNVKIVIMQSPLAMTVDVVKQAKNFAYATITVFPFTG